MLVLFGSALVMLDAAAQIGSMNGSFFEGTGDLSFLELLDVARRQSSSKVKLQAALTCPHTREHIKTYPPIRNSNFNQLGSCTGETGTG